MSNLENSISRSPVPIGECGAANLLEFLGDRWSWLIIREALYGVTRFDNIREDLDIPRSVLSTRLKKLVGQGILETRPYRQKGERSRKAYVLTEKGRALTPIIIAMMQWGDHFLRKGEPSITLKNSETNEVVYLSFVNKTADIVPVENLSFEVSKK